MAAAGLASRVQCIEEVPAPPVPKCIEDTGISPSIVEHLIFKFLYFRGELSGRELSALLGLRFSVIDDTIEALKIQHLVVVKRSSGFGNVSAQLALTEAGRARARECLEFNQYMGPAPVPLDQYADIVRRQRPKEGWLTPEALAAAYRNIVMSPRVLAMLGPAINAGSSFLVYGMPGDGKSYMAENLANVYSSHIYLPYAIECQGNIVQVYDPVYHIRVEEPASSTAVIAESAADARWVKCKRPFLVTGGELTLETLDLSYNPTSKIYDAPFQLKANNGIYLIDDFGRQRATPAEVLNRWIVPMERRLDYLTFRSGGKMTVPFECFLVFSTNLDPQKLGDEAFLRRIQYKLHLHGPSQPEFIEIFRRFCKDRGLACPDGLIDRFLTTHYKATGKPMRRCHPRDVLSHAINMLQFEGRPFVLTDDVLDRAFASCFVEESEKEASAAEPWYGLESGGIPLVCETPKAETRKHARVSGTDEPPPSRSTWKQTVASIRSTFGKLLYYSSLRDASTGRYVEPALEAECGPAEADRVLAANHCEVFSTWLGGTLGHQKVDLERYLASLNDGKRAALKSWLRSRSYTELLPRECTEQDRRLFLADMESLLAMLGLAD